MAVSSSGRLMFGHTLVFERFLPRGPTPDMFAPAISARWRIAATETHPGEAAGTILSQMRGSE
jgi:hypothetical protein